MVSFPFWAQIKYFCTNLANTMFIHEIDPRTNPDILEAHANLRSVYDLCFFVFLQMLMNVVETTGANTVARTCWEVIAAAAHRVTFNTTNGTSVLVSPSARMAQLKSTSVFSLRIANFYVFLPSR